MTQLRRLAVIATRGTSNNLFQIATLVRAATALEASVEVIFRGDALIKMTQSRIDLPEWSSAYDVALPLLEERLKAAEFTTMEAFLREAKEHGDDVRYWACSETLRDAELRLGDLSGLIDGELELSAFIHSTRAAETLTF